MDLKEITPIISNLLHNYENSPPFITLFQGRKSYLRKHIEHRKANIFQLDVKEKM